MSRRSKTSARWSARNEEGVRDFLPFGNAKTVRLVLLKDGVVVDRCGVHNVQTDIDATFRELVRLHGGGEGFTYELQPAPAW